MKCGCVFSSARVLSVAPQDVRYGCTCSLVVLLFQVRNHAWCKEKRCADEHLHTECKEEYPGRVVCVQRTTSKASGEVCNDEEYAAVTRMIFPLENARVSKGRDLSTAVSIMHTYKVEG